MKRFLIGLFCAVSLILLPSCKDMGRDVVAPVLPDPVPVVPRVSYQAQIVPIFQRHGCSSCHGGSGGLFVLPYAQLMTGGTHGPVIVAGQAENSNLIKKLTLTVPPFGVRMPQGGPYLPDSTVQVIKEWINQGAENN